jgi:GntR family transcriptional regulator, transcriptional repressor for pyruvate dehydrogenase complex
VSLDLTSLIAPLASAGRAEEVTLRLTEAIHLGILGDGQQLPAESEFAQQLGVSPMTLREAIANLREQGLVETRRGRSGGTFVCRALEPPSDPDRRRLEAMTVSSLRDLADELAAVSGAAARLTADRCTPSDLRKLFLLVDQMANATTRGSRMKADSRFHIELAMSSMSERLTRHEVRLQGEISGLLWLESLPEEEVAAMWREHHEIATAIAEENGERARLMAERHVRRNLRRIIASRLALVDEGGAA